jgi:hypothetical protein
MWKGVAERGRVLPATAVSGTGLNGDANLGTVEQDERSGSQLPLARCAMPRHGRGTMSEVSVIGCGAMGCAVITALAEAAERLVGETVVIVPFSTPEQATSLRELVVAAGGRCLDLAIPAYPSEIGTDAANLLVSGAHEAFVEHRARLEAFGTLLHVGQLPGAAFINEMAVSLPYLPMSVSLMQGARIWELHGLSVERFADTVMRIQPPATAALLERLRLEDTSDPADVAAWLPGSMPGSANTTGRASVR